jgi:hypothetical protein
MNNYVKTFEEFTNKKIIKKLSKLKHLTSYEDNVAEEEDRIQKQQEISQRGAANLNIEQRSII